MSLEPWITLYIILSKRSRSINDKKLTREGLRHCGLCSAPATVKPALSPGAHSCCLRSWVLLGVWLPFLPYSYCQASCSWYKSPHVKGHSGYICRSVHSLFPSLRKNEDPQDKPNLLFRKRGTPEDSFVLESCLSAVSLFLRKLEIANSLHTECQLPTYENIHIIKT